MEIPKDAYRFVRRKMIEAGYHHAIHQEREDCSCVGFGDGDFLYSNDHCPKCGGTGKILNEKAEVIDMNGIAVQAEDKEETTEHQVMRALVDWINENEHCCPGCVKDVSGDPIKHHEADCPVIKALLLTGDWNWDEEFEL
jgi:hypothetical protein